VQHLCCCQAACEPATSRQLDCAVGENQEGIKPPRSKNDGTPAGSGGGHGPEPSRGICGAAAVAVPAAAAPPAASAAGRSLARRMRRASSEAACSAARAPALSSAATAALAAGWPPTAVDAAAASRPNRAASQRAALSNNGSEPIFLASSTPLHWGGPSVSLRSRLCASSPGQ